jgi:hypothetical protein
MIGQGLAQRSGDFLRIAQTGIAGNFDEVNAFLGHVYGQTRTHRLQYIFFTTAERASRGRKPN